MSGFIQDVGFWNRVLSDDEMEQLYNDGSGIIPESGSFRFDVQFNFYEPDTSEFKEKRGEGGVFFSHKEEVTEDGKAHYTHPDTMSWTGSIGCSGVLPISGKFNTPGGGGLSGSGLLCIPVGT